MKLEHRGWQGLPPALTQGCKGQRKHLLSYVPAPCAPHDSLDSTAFVCPDTTGISCQWHCSHGQSSCHCLLSS